MGSAWHDAAFRAMLCTVKKDNCILQYVLMQQKSQRKFGAVLERQIASDVLRWFHYVPAFLKIISVFFQ
jgi:hypothetical protein